MIWVSTALTPTPVQQGLTLTGTISILCIDAVASVQGILKANGISSSVLLTNSSNGGCNIVTQSPSPPAAAARFNYKLFFAVSAQQFLTLSNAFATSAFIKQAHIMCGSTVYFQTVQGGTVAGVKNLSPNTYPSWMNPNSGVCYDSINDPIHA